jgi:hypothetical protein
MVIVQDSCNCAYVSEDCGHKYQIDVLSDGTINITLTRWEDGNVADTMFVELNKDQSDKVRDAFAFVATKEKN